MSDHWEELGYTWPDAEPGSTSIELDNVNLEALKLMYGEDILRAINHPGRIVHDLYLESRELGNPKYVAPTGWRRFIPGAQARATRDWKRRMEAWYMAGAPNLTKATYIPMAVFVPKERHDG
jgi:hypothetical protein